MNQGPIFNLNISKELSRLTINSNLHITYPNPWPNAWWRFWQWVFFGFKWEDLRKK